MERDTRQPIRCAPIRPGAEWAGKVIGRIWIEGEVKGEPVNERTDRPNAPPPAEAGRSRSGSTRRGVVADHLPDDAVLVAGDDLQASRPRKVQSDAEVLRSVPDGA